MDTNLSKEQLGELSQLRHIRNLLKTVLFNVTDSKFLLVNQQHIQTIEVNIQRALGAVNNGIEAYRIKEQP